MKTAIGRRKELRRQQRVEKKQRRANRHIPINNHSSKPRNKMDNLVKEVSEDESVVESDEDIKTPPIEKKRQLELFAKNNPELYESLLRDNLIDDSSALALNKRDDLDQDELISRRYAKKLKLKRGKESKSVGFQRDGLDYLLDLVDQPTRLVEQDSVGEDNEDDDSTQTDNSDQDSSLDSSSESDTDTDISIDNVEMEEESLAKDSSSDSSLESALEEETKTEPECSQKYIPVHLRPPPTEKQEIYSRLKRSLQGHLNKLTENNIESIVNSIEGLYQSNVRHDVTEILTQSILNSLTSNSSLLDGFIVVYACLVAILFSTVGLEVGALFFQSLVEHFDKVYAESLSTNTSELEQEQKAKTTLNTLTFICHLYNFRVISNKPVSGLFSTFIDNLRELDVELVLRVVKSCGLKFRAEDPLALRDIITQFHEKTRTLSSSTSSSTLSSRFKFMAEQITNLKNNRGDLCKKSMEKQHQGGNGGGETVEEKLRKFMRNYLKKRSCLEREPLGCTLEDLRNVESKGKWWLVGAAWVGRQHGDESLQPLSASKSSSSSIPTDHPLYALARKLNINTEIRRAIFVALMGSEDSIDAFESITKLKLKHQQEREIIRIIFFCCAMEKSYNHYYCLVGEKFCKMGHQHRISFQFALWDYLKELSARDSSATGSERKLKNISRLYANLILCGALSLSVMKAMDFAIVLRETTLDDSLPPVSLAKFLQLLLSLILFANGEDNKSETEKIQSIFAKVTGLSELNSFREGLRLCMGPVVKSRVDECAKAIMADTHSSKPINLTKQLLLDRVKIAKQALTQTSYT